MEYQPPQFFKRGPAPLARLTFFGLLSVLLMVLDARFQYAEPLRHGLTLAIYPLQQVATAPVSRSGVPAPRGVARQSRPSDADLDPVRRRLAHRGGACEHDRRRR